MLVVELLKIQVGDFFGEYREEKFQTWVFLYLILMCHTQVWCECFLDGIICKGVVLMYDVE